MSRYQLTKRFCNPLGLKDAKYFGHRKTRLKRTRTEPLPGTKTLQPSEKDGKIQELFVPKEIKPEPCSMTQIMDWVSMVLSGFIAVVASFSLFVGLDEDFFSMCFLAFFGIHICVFFGQCFAGWRNKRLWISLGVTYLFSFIVGMVAWLS